MGYQMTDTYKNYIDGEWVTARSGETFESVEPADTDRVLGQFQRSTEEDAQRAIEAANEAQEQWQSLSRIDRAAYIEEVFKILEQRTDELGELVSRECGKELSEGKADVVEAIHMLQYAFGNARQPTGEVVESEIPAKDSYVHRQPAGVVASITPWNFPIAIPIWLIAIPLIEGNTVVWKPAEQTPKCAVKLMEVFDEAGIPDGVINMITGYGEDSGAPLVSSNDVDSVLFTGSAKVGQMIQKDVAVQGDKQCACEMGGKNAIIVTEDADMDIAVHSAIMSAYKTTGQRCVSAERVLVHEDVIDEFQQRFVSAAEKINYGHPVEDDVFMGPLVDDAQVEKTKEWNQRVRDLDAAEVLVDRETDIGEEHADGRFVGPFAYRIEYDDDIDVLHEEVFGPHVAIMPYSDLDEAIEIHNSVEYGLAMAICTEDYRKARRARQDCEVGLGYVNLPSIGAEVHLPFGGVKKSGSGIASGKDIIRAVTHRKAWTVNNEKDIEMAQGLSADIFRGSDE
ncbi:MAG: aldehyde dehydrogenase family protein [Candidatus Nanohaloarchaeota archaeon QJJ-5]|nr:aldehyde dehydrogenase family protein [Candidatus Nanohaloarchaeota archaeon QJJ-5]